MRIVSVYLKNIKAHREKEMPFAPGINVLSGPNGAGKSTIFEAIGYALFGVDARDFVSRIDRFLTIGEKRGEIQVVFEPGDGETYRVSRTVGPGAKWLLAQKQNDAFLTEEHAGLAETEARIAELLGLDNGRPLKEQFRQIIGPFQNDFLGPFVIKSPTERQKTFDNILGIDSWRRTFEGTAELQRTVVTRRERLEAEISGRQEQVAVLPQLREELKSIKTHIAERTECIREQSAQHLQLESRLKAHDSQEQSLREKTAEHKRIEDRIANGKEHVANQQQQVAQAQEAIRLVEANRSGALAFEQAEKELTVLRKKEYEKRTLENQLQTSRLEHSKRQQQISLGLKSVSDTARQIALELSQLEQSAKELEIPEQVRRQAEGLTRQKTHAEELKEQRARLLGTRGSLQEGQNKLGEGLCPFFKEPCPKVEHQSPDDVFRGRLSELDSKVAQLDEAISAQGTIVAQGEEAERELAALSVRRQALEKQQQSLLQRRKDNTAKEDEILALRPQLEQLSEAIGQQQETLSAFAELEQQIRQADEMRRCHQAARDLFYSHRQAAEDLEPRKQTLARYTQAVEALQKQAAEQTQAIEALRAQYNPEAHDADRRQKDQLVATIAALNQELKDLERRQKRLEKDIDTLRSIQKEIDERKSSIRTLKEKEKLIRYLRNDVFKNVSGRLSERFREEISQRADRIYRTISQADEELVWGENYQVTLRDIEQGTIRERNDDQLSGGQMMSAVVALRLALLQTIGARIAFFDEPTSNLDAGRRENLAEAFRAIDIGKEEVTEHWYDQLFLISHDVAFTEITDQLIDLQQ